MTIEELAKLKKGDKLMCGERIFTFDHAQAVLFDRCREKYHLDIQVLRVLPGPNLPPHIAEVFEWDGEPKRVVMEGWSWAEDLSGKVCYGPRYGNAYGNAWGVIPKIRKESK